MFQRKGTGGRYFRRLRVLTADPFLECRPRCYIAEHKMRVRSVRVVGTPHESVGRDVLDLASQFTATTSHLPTSKVGPPKVSKPRWVNTNRINNRISAFGERNQLVPSPYDARI